MAKTVGEWFASDDYDDTEPINGAAMLAAINADRSSRAGQSRPRETWEWSITASEEIEQGNRNRHLTAAETREIIMRHYSAFVDQFERSIP